MGLYTTIHVRHMARWGMGPENGFQSLTHIHSAIDSLHGSMGNTIGISTFIGLERKFMKIQTI